MDFDLPAPKGDGLDLPLPEDADLPFPDDLDLLAPSELPAPKGGSDLQPARADVVPKYGSELEPREGDVAPKYGSELEPRASGSAMELDADDLEAADSASGTAAGSRSARSARSSRSTGRIDPGDSMAPGFRAADSVRSPSPKPDERSGRGLLYAGIAGLALAATGAGLYAAGLVPLGDNEPGGADRAIVAPERSGPAKDRSAQVLAALAADSPEGYLRAVELAQADGDAVGQAEAALAFHLRYGPDPVLAGQAESLLEPHQQLDAPHVRRVVALLALANGDLEGAAKALAADGIRTDLYRGWLNLRQRDPAAALEQADKTLAKAEDLLGALMTRHVAQLEMGEEGALVALERSAKAHAEHLGLQVLLTEALFERGRLADADAKAQSLTVDAASKAYQAEVAALRGRIAAAQGNRGLALREYDKALELAANDAVKLERLRALLLAREFADVRAGVDVLLHERPQFVDAMLLQAELAIATGDGDQALEVLQRAEAVAQGDARIPLLTGQVHAMRMAVEDAEQAFRRARERDPKLLDATIEEARMLAKAERLADGLELIRDTRTTLEAAEAPPESIADLIYAEATLLQDARRDREARAVLDELLNKDPNHLDGRLLRGKLLLSEGDVAAARSDLEQLYERTGGYPGLAAPLGRIYLRSGNLDALRKLLGGQLDQDSPNELLLLGARLRLHEGKLEEARSLVDQALNNNPASTVAHLVRAQILLREGDAEGAHLEIQQARPRDPDAEYELWSGQILEALRRPNEALAFYRRAVELEPTMIEAQYRLGHILALRGGGQEAIRALQHVVQQTDAYPEAWYAMGVAYHDVGDPRKALEALIKATELDETIADAWYWQGRLHSDQNNHAAAIKSLRKAIEGGTEDRRWLPLAYRMLGNSYYETGNRVEAKATLLQYLKIAPPEDPGRAEAMRKLQSL